MGGSEGRKAERQPFGQWTHRGVIPPTGSPPRTRALSSSSSLVGKHHQGTHAYAARHAPLLLLLPPCLRLVIPILSITTTTTRTSVIDHQNTTACPPPPVTCAVSKRAPLGALTQFQTHHTPHRPQWTAARPL